MMMMMMKKMYMFKTNMDLEGYKVDIDLTVSTFHSPLSNTYTDADVIQRDVFSSDTFSLNILNRGLRYLFYL